MRLIDADALLDKFYQERPTITDVDDYYYLVENAPIIDAEPVKHGRWIEKQQAISYCEDDVDVFYKCSVCGCQCCGESPYCPNCGAKMEVQNETD